MVGGVGGAAGWAEMRVIQGRCDGRGRVARARPWLHCADQTARGWRDRWCWCWCWCWCGVRGARESGRAAGSSEEQGRGTRSGAAQLVLRAGDASINQWLSVRPVGSGEAGDRRRGTGDVDGLVCGRGGLENSPWPGGTRTDNVILKKVVAGKRGKQEDKSWRGLGMRVAPQLASGGALAVLHSGD